MKNPSFKNAIFNNLINGIIVFTSVYFAFWLTNFKEGKRIERDVQKGLKNIASEVKFNHLKIESKIDYHLEIESKLDSIKENDSKQFDTLDVTKVVGWRGIEFPRLRSDAYNSFINSGLINNLKFEKQKLLFETYEWQLILSEIENAITKDFIASSKNIAEKSLNISGTFTEVLPGVLINYQTSGKTLLEKHGYDEALKGVLKIPVEKYIKKINAEKKATAKNGNK